MTTGNGSENTTLLHFRQLMTAKRVLLNASPAGTLSFDEDDVAIANGGMEDKTNNIMKENIDPNDGERIDASNRRGGVDHLATMKRIMRRKRNTAQDARREMESNSSRTTNSFPSVDDDGCRLGSSRKTTTSTHRDVHVKDDDLGGLAMMGNRLEEDTTLDRQDGALSFLCDDDSEGHQLLLVGVSSEYVRRQSAYKVRRLEEHLLRGVGTVGTLPIADGTEGARDDRTGSRRPSGAMQ